MVQTGMGRDRAYSQVESWSAGEVERERGRETRNEKRSAGQSEVER